MVAARRCGFDPADLVGVGRAALVHDLGRVAVPVRIWQKATVQVRDQRHADILLGFVHLTCALSCHKSLNRVTV